MATKQSTVDFILDQIRTARPLKSPNKRIWKELSCSRVAMINFLKRRADVNQDAIAGTTALHAAAMGGSTRGSRDPEAYQRTAEILIAHGADVNPRAGGDRQQTPLDDAIKNNNDNVTAVLRKHGAQVSNRPK